MDLPKILGRARQPDYSIKTPLLISVAVLSIAFARLVYISQLPLDKWIQFVPDDAFYYWRFAVNANENGLWSLNGQDVSTGFHVLFAYVLRLMHLVTDDVRLAFASVGLIAALALGLSSFLMASVVARTFGRFSAIASGVPFFAPAALAQTTFGMESWLTLLLSALLVFGLCRFPTGKSWLALGLIAVLGTLARTDYVVFAFALALMLLLPKSRFSRPKPGQAFAVLGGSILGLALVASHTYLVGGHLDQASAATKAHWASVTGRSWGPVLDVIAGTLVPPVNHILVGAMFMGVIIGTLFSWGALWRGDRRVNFLFPFALVTLTGFAIAYYFNSAGIQPWYQANFLVPFSLLIAGMAYPMSAKPLVLIGVGAVTLFVALNLVRGNYTKSVWSFQEGMLAASRSTAVQELPPESVIGSWNSGIHATFTGRTIVNLDGLANDNASEAATTGRLADYIGDRGITHILDFEQMVSSEQLAVRGGYETQQLSECLVPLGRVDDGIGSWTGSPLLLFEVTPGCLSGL